MSAKYYTKDKFRNSDNHNTDVGRETYVICYVMNHSLKNWMHLHMERANQITKDDAHTGNLDIKQGIICLWNFII